MELTDDEIRAINERSKNDRAIIVGSEIRALCAMALAHNAARKAEVAAVVYGVPNSLPFRKAAFLAKDLPQGTELFTASPDLEAKLREARDVVTFILGNANLTDAGYQKCKDFLERTKP